MDEALTPLKMEAARLPHKRMVDRHHHLLRAYPQCLHHAPRLDERSWRAVEMEMADDPDGRGFKRVTGEDDRGLPAADRFALPLVSDLLEARFICRLL